ncbi:hypothetical protein K438DRAFT_1759265 [Mycena galopus ATCC 62051]|nr:hypothetical protein K438DRAFT_1759265 [Mycena galopus ATCC 62051]
MFSFSKVLAFGLVALSSVRAVPFMQTSCTVDFGTSVGPAHAFNVLDPGVYRIVNVATNTPVAASVQNGQIYVTIEGQQPGALAEWKLEKADQGGFKITNIALGTSIFSSNEGLLFCGWVTPAETFAVEPAGSGEFILTYSFKIKEVAADEEWTLAPVAGSPFGTIPRISFTEKGWSSYAAWSPGPPNGSVVVFTGLIYHPRGPGTAVSIVIVQWPAPRHSLSIALTCVSPFVQRPHAKPHTAVDPALSRLGPMAQIQSSANPISEVGRSRLCLATGRVYPGAECTYIVEAMFRAHTQKLEACLMDRHAMPLNSGLLRSTSALHGSSSMPFKFFLSTLGI